MIDVLQSLVVPVGQLVHTRGECAVRALLFKYLCDLTHPSRKERVHTCFFDLLTVLCWLQTLGKHIPCRLIRGKLGGEYHAWNVVIDPSKDNSVCLVGLPALMVPAVPGRRRHEQCGQFLLC